MHSPDEQLQARVVGWFIVLGVPVTGLMLIVNLTHHSLREAVLGLAASVVVLAMMQRARVRRSFGSLGHVVGVVQLVLNLFAVVVEDDWAALAWLAVAPLAVLFFSGARVAIAWAVIVTIALWGSVWWESHALAPERAATLLSLATSHWVLTPVLLGLGLGFRRARDEAMRAAERARTAAEAANRAKTSFLASMSHEIRTPLNGVLGTTELLLLREAQFDAATKEDLHTIHASGGMLLRLLNELLDLTRIEAGRLEIVQSDFAVGPAVAESFALFRAVSRSKGVTLEHRTTLPPELWLRGDSVRLRQVLNNLVGNAVKFTDTGGHIELRCSGTRSSPTRWDLVLEVEDDGRGIAAEHFRDVFEPYLQLHHTDAQVGTGLGLPVARALARAMGGDLVVHSVVGKGSTFTLSISLDEAQARAVSPQPQGVAHYSGRALVVDDNAVNLRVAAAMVAKLGFEVSTANDGAKAIDALEHGTFDFVLMDRHMPVLDGLEATRRQRLREARHTLARVPIIAVTASLLADEVEACRGAGMDEVLPKPLQLAELERVVAGFVSR